VVRESTYEEEHLRLARFEKYYPPTFSWLALENVHGFLEECYHILCIMGIVEASEIAFSRFQLKGEAY